MLYINRFFTYLRGFLYVLMTGTESQVLSSTVCSYFPFELFIWRTGPRWVSSRQCRATWRGLHSFLSVSTVHFVANSRFGFIESTTQPSGDSTPEINPRQNVKTGIHP